MFGKLVNLDDDLRTSNRPHSSRPKRSPSAASWLWPTFDRLSQDCPPKSNGFLFKTAILGVPTCGQTIANPSKSSAEGCSLHLEGTMRLLGPGHCWRRGIWGSALVLLKLCDAIVFLLHLLRRSVTDSAAVVFLFQPSTHRLQTSCGSSHIKLSTVNDEYETWPWPIPRMVYLLEPSAAGFVAPAILATYLHAAAALHLRNTFHHLLLAIPIFHSNKTPFKTCSLDWR